MEITPEIIESHGLKPDEYQKIVQLLGREPNITELGIFSVMWSEHCSYKSSKVHLKRLPTRGDRVVQGPGENAGIIDIGDGWAVAFKIESHNHPSFIEPYQGAATGVGGILRDIFTMGARPIAAMNSLRFGPLDAARNRSIMIGVVKGIGDYGNSFGVATVGGEVYFADCYSLNPLVNAFALGIVREDQIFFGKAAGVGNPVIYVGAKTGRDGIHGATMASAEFDEEAGKKRPTVQVGDPFYEKLLLESCLEAMRTGAVVGIQDMGAAGLTCSTCEMGARAGTGIEMDLSLVPQREQGMTPYEIMLSESQERMLLVARKGREREIIDIFKKWDLDAVVIGRVTDDGLLRVLNQGQVVAEIPNAYLTDEAPVYNRPMKAPERATEAVEIISPGDYYVNPEPDPSAVIVSVEEGGELADSSSESATAAARACYNQALLRMLTSPNICSKEWVYQQYDYQVRTNTVVLPGADAAVIRIKETRKALAMTLDGNGRYCHLNPREGAKLIVAEACRNLVCVGALPIAATNCLNFASPERPEVMWSFSEVIDGMAEACRYFQTPITGGNVSFYNETEGRGVYPTPVIGMVGLIEDVHQVITCGFKEEDEVVVLLGETYEDMGGTEYLERICGRIAGNVPRLDLERERAVQRACLEAIQSGIISSAHDCSDGGLAVTLAESCFSSYGRRAIGAEINLAGAIPALAQLFSESPSRIVLSLREENVEKLQEIAASHNAPCTIIGRAGGSQLRISVGGEELIRKSVAELELAWRSALSQALQTKPQVSAEQITT